jgi:hypothetical protein
MIRSDFFDVLANEKTLLVVAVRSAVVRSVPGTCARPITCRATAGMCPCTMLPVGSARDEHVCAFQLHKRAFHDEHVSGGRARMLRARGRPWCGQQVGVSGLLPRPRCLSHQSLPLSVARALPPPGRTSHSRLRLARLLATLQTSLSVNEMHTQYCIWDVSMSKRCMPQTMAGGSGSGYREMRARETPNVSLYTSHDGLPSHDGLVGGMSECDFVMELKIPRFGPPHVPQPFRAPKIACPEASACRRARVSMPLKRLPVA